MSTKELIGRGEKLGLRDAELRAWLEAEQARAAESEKHAREERAAEREASRMRAEAEERALQLRIRLQEASNVQERSAAGDRRAEESPSMFINPHRMILPFDEKRDDLDTYLKRFENIATGYNWPREKWATAFSMCLGGEALKVFGRLSPEDSVDFEKAKLALLQRFRFAAEGYREKFRESKPQEGETGKQYAARISSLFDRWVETSGTAANFKDLRDLVVAEQFLNKCHSRLALFLRERKCKTLSEIAEAADGFLEAQ